MLIFLVTLDAANQCENRMWPCLTWDNVRIVDPAPIGATELAVSDAFPIHQDEEHSFESQH